jgi:hypothetical protein
MSVPFAQRPWFKGLYLALFSYGAISNFYLGHPWIGAMLLVSVFMYIWTELIAPSR